MHEDKKQFIADLFWQFADEHGIEQTDPTDSPIKPDIHWSFELNANDWDYEPVDEGSENYFYFKSHLRRLASVIARRFRDRLSTLKVEIHKKKDEDDGADYYYVYIIASLCKQRGTIERSTQRTPPAPPPTADWRRDAMLYRNAR
jgi:hypothetical protein